MGVATKELRNIIINNLHVPYTGLGDPEWHDDWTGTFIHGFWKTPTKVILPRILCRATDLKAEVPLLYSSKTLVQHRDSWSIMKHWEAMNRNFVSRVSIDTPFIVGDGVWFDLQMHPLFMFTFTYELSDNGNCLLQYPDGKSLLVSPLVYQYDCFKPIRRLLNNYILPIYVNLSSEYNTSTNIAIRDLEVFIQRTPEPSITEDISDEMVRIFKESPKINFPKFK